MGVTADCACTIPTALTTSPTAQNRCVPGQFAKLIFQRYSTSNNFDGSGTSPTNAIGTAASWSGLSSASDDTKVIISPYAFDASFGESTVFTDGENFAGGEAKFGNGPSPFTAMFKNISATQYDALKALVCEDDNLAVYFIDRQDNFFVRQVSTDIHNGFLIVPSSMNFGNPTKDTGAAAQYNFTMTFELFDGWYSQSDKVVPAAGFSPISSLTAS